MRSPAEAFAALLRAAREAEACIGALVCDVAVAGRTLRIVCAGDALAGVVTPAFGHLFAGARAPDLTIHVFDSASSRVPLPPVVRAAVEEGRYGMPGSEAEGGILTAFQRLDPGLTMMDAAAGQGVCWIPSIATLPSEWQASPLRSALHWWLRARGLQLMHVAAVADDRGAVLVAGKGGSGKSTTALTCLLGGLRFLGDDFCAVGLGPSPTVYSLYASAKVHGPNLARLPELSRAVANPGRPDNEKAVLLFAGEEWPLAAQMPVVAIVAPQVCARPASTFERVSGAIGLATLAPSTVLQLTGSGGDALRTMAALARAVPSYSLKLGADRAGVVEAVRGIIAAAAS